MKLTTCLLPSYSDQPTHCDLHVPRSLPDVAVVIDVLRATSVIVTALDNGATEVVTCREVEEAIRIADQRHPKPLLCGERGCKPIAGFDLGNSPAEYTAQCVQNRTLVLTTTNGTGAVDSVRQVPCVLIASFLNLSAVTQALRDFHDILLVCAGTEGRVTLEDVLLAGAILWRCHLDFDVEIDEDDSVLALQLWRSWFPQASSSGRAPEPDALSRCLRQTRGGRNLVSLGFHDDLDRCARIDSIKVVPRRVTTSPATFALPRS